MPTQSRNCPVCGKEFFKRVSTKRWESNQGKYCSRKCSGESLKDIPGRRTRYIGWPSSPATLDNESIIHWDEAHYDDNKYCRVPITCGLCHSKRTIDATNTRGKHGETFCGLCHSCNLQQHREIYNSGDQHPAWKGGVFITGGYRYIQLANLTGRDFEIAKPMARHIHKQSTLISEHRLVVALSLNRSLLSSEIVHHRNGNKLDNRLGNLEITTHSDHRKLDVKYYNLWTQALLQITELESEIAELRDKLLRF